MDIIFYHGSALDKLKTLSEDSVDCCVTSPPYWGLRDYGVDGQLGLESNYIHYIEKLCDIFDEVKRILKPTGTCWVNIADTYGGSGDKGKHRDPKYFNGRNGQSVAINRKAKAKSLCQIPERFSIEMTNRGWIKRNTIIWHKPNVMPSSVKDRFTVDFEYVYFFTKNKKYFFCQQLEPYTAPINRWGGERLKATNYSFWDAGTEQNTYRERAIRPNLKGRNKRTVWTVPTKPLKAAHFATFPEALIYPMIRSGCPDFGVVVDPFSGAGTTGLVARKQNKSFIGIEINADYIKIAEQRFKKYGYDFRY